MTTIGSLFIIYFQEFVGVQHDHHFKLGNDSGDFVPPSAYRESVTRGDFDMKPTTKVHTKTFVMSYTYPTYKQHDNISVN